MTVHDVEEAPSCLRAVLSSLTGAGWYPLFRSCEGFHGFIPIVAIWVVESVRDGGVQSFDHVQHQIVAWHVF